MKNAKKTRIIRALVLCLVLGAVAPAVIGWGKSKDPLPSWNEGPIKHKIIRFVEDVSNSRSKNFVPHKDRVAVVDLDGTLLVENPVNFQRTLAIKRLKEKVRENMDLRHRQPFKAAWEDDEAFYNYKDNHSHVFLEAFKGYSQHEYDAYVRDYLKSHKPEYWGRSFQELFYAPGIELVRYLERKGFHVYVCSTTEEVCIRILLEEVLGFEPRRVIGNEVALNLEVRDEHVHFVMQDTFRLPENREHGKCLYCNNTIGKHPVFAFGNTMGDFELLRYTHKNPRASMVMVLDHDDPERELEYHDEKLLSASQSMGWDIISMKRDFKRVFGFEK